MYLGNLHKKDQAHFATAEGSIGPLKAIFRNLDFKPLVFVRDIRGGKYQCRGICGASSGVWNRANGHDNGISYVEAVKAAMRRRYMTELTTEAWKGYANMMLDRTKYVGTGAAGTNKAQVRQAMVDRADEGEFTLVISLGLIWVL